MNARMTVEERLTSPASIKEDNACVYVTLSYKDSGRSETAI